jgi:23S rRNA (guanosine2251-2'-O)-methyltransferase
MRFPKAFKSMVGRHKRLTRKTRPELGNHQKCWIWGRNLVLETLRAHRWPIIELHLARSAADQEIQRTQQLARELDISVNLQTRVDLQKLCGSRDHQGYVAKMGEYPYVSLPELLASKQHDTCPLFVVCDGIQDPFNLGAILRTAEALRITGVIMGLRNQVGVTSHVARSSAGAVNHLEIARSDDLLGAAGRLQDRGIQLVGASEKAERPLSACDMRSATAVVIGNEGRGVQADLWEQCDQRVGIPLTGQVASLNAAVAAGIMLYEAHRQRQEHRPGQSHS